MSRHRSRFRQSRIMMDARKTRASSIPRAGTPDGADFDLTHDGRDMAMTSPQRATIFAAAMIAGDHRSHGAAATRRQDSRLPGHGAGLRVGNAVRQGCAESPRRLPGRQAWYSQVPYRENIQEPLDSLRERKFRAGRYFPALPDLTFSLRGPPPGLGAPHTSIAAARAVAAVAGVDGHSVESGFRAREPRARPGHDHAAGS
jgi:hypothetical protein